MCLSKNLMEMENKETEFTVSAIAVLFRMVSYFYLSVFLLAIVQLLSYVQLFVTPWTAACQAPLSFSVSQSLLKFMCTESVILSNHLILCCTLLLLPSIFPASVFSSELALHISSVQFSQSAVSDSLRPRGLQHARPPCPSPNSWSLLKLMSIESVMPSNHLILFVPFSSWPQSFPTSGSFQMSQLFASAGQTIGASASASVLPANIQGWFPLGLTGLISLMPKGLSRVFSNTAVKKL